MAVAAVKMPWVILASLLLLSRSPAVAKDVQCPNSGEDTQQVSLLQLEKKAVSRRGRGHATTRVVPTYQLNDGYPIPAIGLGTYRMAPGEETYRSVRDALEVGYRMIDTARVYRNEADVGQAIRDSGIPRSEIFVTTKVWNIDHGYDRAMLAGTTSNALLGLGYIDLLLIHGPAGGVQGPGKIVETYDALMELKRQGIVRSIGVSNFGIAHLEALSNYCRPAPAVNQFELHPLIWEDRKAVVEHCQAQGTLVQAYGSVLSGHAELLALAEQAAQAHGKTTAQVMLRWALDKGFQVIPKSTHRERIEENFDVFDFSLTQEEMANLDSLKAPPQLTVKSSGGLTEYWDPLDHPVDIGNATSHC